jgi:hypothetical protein
MEQFCWSATFMPAFWNTWLKSTADRCRLQILPLRIGVCIAGIDGRQTRGLAR